MKDKKLHKYTFEMSKLEFTNSLEMYINSSHNKIFIFQKLFNLKLKKDYFDLYEIIDYDKYVGKFDFIAEHKFLKIVGEYKIIENWMSSKIRPFMSLLFFSVFAPIAIIIEILKNVDSQILSIFILILTLIYLIIAPFKVYKFFANRKKKRQAEKLEYFQEDIEVVFDYIKKERQK